MVPEGWHVAKLGQVFNSRRERGSDGLPTISVTLNNGLVLRESLERKTDTSLSPTEHLLVRKGDIAYNMMRMWQGASGLARFDALVSPAYVVLKPTDDIDPLFASYLFKTDRMKYLFSAYSYGLTSDRLRLYFQDFSLIQVALPPLEEQLRIGKLLSTWDVAIETANALIRNSEAQKKALISELLLGKSRLAGFGKPASGRTLPADWKMISLGQLGECITGLTYSPQDVVSAGGLLVLRSSNIHENEICFGDDVYVSSEVPKDALTRSGDILISVRNGSRDLIGKNAMIDDSAAGMAHGAFMAVYRSDENYYLAHLFQSKMFFKQVSRNLGATINSINISNLKKFKFPFPPREERRAIASLLSASQRELTQLRKYVTTLQLEKRALMQRLLTGSHRLRDSEGKEVARA